ncbi:trichohyalin-like [Pithys albifrons albifrons]|uniref:trichohyalin-like n=1 Tax=Pithys albifrons albifrons TaxID=3385563 RepID=UPI003A5CD303
MEKQKRNPKSKSPSPLPSWMEDQALSGQWEGAVGESDLPLSLTEEGTFLDMDKDWNDDKDQELSRSGDVTRSQDVTLQELYQWEEEVTVRERSQQRARRQRELYQREEKVTVRELSQWHDRRQPELHQREEKVTVQELHQWEEGGVRYTEVTQWEESVTVQELSHLEEKKPPQWLSEWGEELRGQDQILRRVQRPRDLSSLEEDVRGTELTLRRVQRPRELPSWEEDVRGKELSQSRDVRDQDPIQNYSAQKLPQRERDVREKKLSRWGADVGCTTWDKALHPGNAGDSQTCPQEGPSSPSSVGTEVAGEAAPELPSSAPAPLSPTDTEPAAAAPARAAEEEKEPQGPLSAEEEKAEGSPAFGEQEPSAGTESDVPAPQSNALLEVQRLSQELEEQRELEQSRAAEMVGTVPSEREESPVPAPQSPCSPSSPSTPEVQGQALSGQQEETEGESLLAVQETEEGALAGEGKDWKSCMEEELSRGEGETNPEPCQGTDYSVQELSQGEGEMGPELSQRKEDVTCNVCDNALGPVNEEDAHTVPQEGSSSPSSVGTEVAGEAAPELPSSAPAPLSPTDTTPVPVPQSPSEGSQALLDANQDMSSEILSQAELELQGSSQQEEEERELEESLTAESVRTVSPELPQTPVNTLESISDGIPALMEAERQIFSEMLGNALFEVQRVSQELEEERDVEQSRVAEMGRSEGSQALLDANQDMLLWVHPVAYLKPRHMSSEILSQAELELRRSVQQLQAQGHLEQTMAAEVVTTVPVEREESPVPAPQGPSERSHALLDFADRIRTEILSQAERELRRSIQQLPAQRELEQSRAAEMVTTVLVVGEESPVPAPQEPSVGNQALLDFAGLISTEILSQAELELRRSVQQLQAQGHLEQTMAAEVVTTVPVEREESPVPAPQGPSERSHALLDFADRIRTEILSQAERELRRSIQQLPAQRELEQSRAAEMSLCSPSSPSAPELRTQILSEQEEDKEAEGESVQALQETQEGAPAGEGIHWTYHVDQEASQWEDEEDQELSQENNTCQQVSQGEDLPEQELFPGQGKADQKLSDWEEYTEEEEPQGEGKSYQEVSDWEENIKQELSQGEGSSSSWEEHGGSVLCRWEDERDRELALQYWQQHVTVHTIEVKPFRRQDECEGNIKEELTQREVSGSQGLSDKEHSKQEEQSEGKGGRSPQVRSSSESFSQEEEESPGHFSSYQDLLSSWEDSPGKEFSHEDSSMGQEFSDWEEHRGSVPSRWEDDSDRELELQDWQQHVTVHTIEVKPFRQEDDEWEELSVLELPQAEEREERLSVPAPRQAWAELRVNQPCRRVPGWASPPQLQPQAPRGDMAVPRRDVAAPRGDVAVPRGDMAAPRGDVAAPRGYVAVPRGDMAAPRGDVAAPKKRPSRLRRALRALGRLFRSCLEGQPED